MKAGSLQVFFSEILKPEFILFSEVSDEVGILSRRQPCFSSMGR